MPTVSIIVPVYNTASYLLRCIASLVNQTYSDLQIILIDDGSTDESGAIADEWQTKDPRIEVYHQQNQGLSCARNTGLVYAKGEYLCFIDSDDYIEAQFVQTLVEMAGQVGSNGISKGINAAVTCLYAVCCIICGLKHSGEIVVINVVIGIHEGNILSFCML